MKGKPFTYLMIISNLAIWGYVVYLLIGWLSSKSDSNTDLNLNLPIGHKTKGLDSIYEDPFLGGHFRTTKEKNKSTSSYSNRALEFPKKESTIQNAAATIVSSPLVDLKFHGIIISTTSNKKTGLLSLRDSSFFLKENETYKNFKLLSLSADSCLFLNEKKLRVAIYKK